MEKCITIAKKGLEHQAAADEFASNEDRNSAGWKAWRESEQWQKWNNAMAPAITARRRAFSLLRDKEAVELLFEEVAPRFMDRPGGYTRVLKLAKPRLGDAGLQGIIEFVGVHDRVKQETQKPAFDSMDDEVEETPAVEEDAEEATDEAAVSDDAEASAEGADATEESTDADGGEDSADESDSKE